MTASRDIFEGLHVLVVSEDDARAQALAKALRERKAHVGDLKGSGRDPMALRGADLLIVDARSAARTEARVAEMQADVRTRWASVARLDFGRVIAVDGTVYLSVLEDTVKPLIASDRALTERGKRDASFSTELSLLGPTRMLRALMHAGPTMQVELTFPGGKASVTLSNELLVCAFAERAGQQWEAWKALARLLGLTDANVSVTRLLHPSAMNIMEPLDQALQTAAQERHTAAAELAREEQQGSQVKIKPQGPDPDNENAQNPAREVNAAAPANKANKERLVSPNRTLMGVAPVLPTPAAAAPAAPAAKPAASRYAFQGEASERVKPNRTMMGMAPGGLPNLGPLGVNKPDKTGATTVPEQASPFAARAATARADSAAAATVPEQESPFNQQGSANKAGAKGAAFGHEAATATEVAPGRRPATDSLPTMPPPAEEVTDLPASVSTNNRPRFGHKAPGLPQSRPGTATARTPRISEEVVRSRMSVGDKPTDPAPAPSAAQVAAADVDLPGLPPAIHDDDDLPGLPPAIRDDDYEEESTTVTRGEALEQLRAQASRASAELEAKVHSEGSTLGDDFAGFAADQAAPQPMAAAPTRPFDSRSVLMEAISEEAHGLSNPPGAAPLPERLRPQPKPAMEPMRRVVERAKSRAGVLSVLLLLAAGELGYVYMTDSKPVGEVIEVRAIAPSAPAKPGASKKAAAKAAPLAAAAQPAAAPAQPVDPKSPAGNPDAKPASPVPAAAPSATAKAPPAIPATAQPQAATQPAKPAQAASAPTPAPAAEAPAAAPTSPGVPTLDDLVRDGNKRLSERNPQAAKALFEAAIALDAKNPHAQAGLSQAFLDLGDAPAAQAAAEAAVRLRPKRAHYRVLLGDALKARGKLEEARAAWEKALEIDPADRNAQKRLAP